jgi:GGDEF domain-containing protein
VFCRCASAQRNRDWRASAAQVVLVSSRYLRAEDTLCHLGGDAYAFSLPHTTPAGAAEVVRRLSRELEGSPQFGIAYLPPGRDASSKVLIEHALRTPVTLASAA